MHSVSRVRAPILIALALISVVAAALVGARISLAAVMQQDEPAGRTIAVNRSLTIGEVTVTLEEVTDLSGMVRIKHSYHTTPEDVRAYDIGSHQLILPDGGIVDLFGGTTRVDDSEISTFKLGSQIPGAEDGIGVKLSSFLVPRPTFVGDAFVSLFPNLKSLSEEAEVTVAQGAEVTIIPLEAEFLAGDEHTYNTDKASEYNVSALTIIQRTGITQFKLTLLPVDAEAKKLAFSSAGPDRVWLQDSEGNVYTHINTAVSWNNPIPPNVKELDRIDLTFAGNPSPLAKWFMIRIDGAAEALGPFVFDKVGIVSEDAPPPDPDLPDDPYPGDGTPVNVNN